MNKKPITVRLEPDTHEQFVELKKYFNNYIEIGKVTNDDVAKLAIKELYMKYVQGTE